MRLKNSTARKLRYGSTSVALTALIIAIVIAVNAIFSMCVQRFTLYVDLTPDLHFTISDECFELIGGTEDDSVDTPIEMLDKFRAENKAYNEANGLTSDSTDYRDEHVMINILFCLDDLELLKSSTAEYVYRNADELRSKYPDYISVECVDSRKIPSRFRPYLSSNTETIGLESVIIECGTEYRIRSIESFYSFDNGEAAAYNGEKAFASSILAVTRAEVPLACYTTNHGESFPTSETLDASGNKIVPFLSTLEDAGYRTQAIDLSKEDIPENCRVLVIFDPKQDFLSGKDGISQVSEIDKLDDFLADRNSLMVFMEPTSYDGETGLANLEEFLAEWGLAFRRNNDDPYIVRDANSMIGNTAAIVGEYANNDLATGWTGSMTSGKSDDKPKVIFPNTVALTYANGYSRQTISSTEEGSPSYVVGYNTTYGRTVYDLFVSSENAKAYAGDAEIASATKTDPFKLMAVSVEAHFEQEFTSAYQDSAYVLLCGSTDFAIEQCLKSNAYGNADFPDSG